MDQEKKNSIIYQIKKGRLIRLSEKQKQNFFKPYSDIKRNMYVSITYEKSDNDLGIYIWYQHYSIGLTYKEFMAIFDKIKDKENLINDIVATEV